MAAVFLIVAFIAVLCEQQSGVFESAIKPITPTFAPTLSTSAPTPVCISSLTGYLQQPYYWLPVISSTNEIYEPLSVGVTQYVTNKDGTLSDIQITSAYSYVIKYSSTGYAVAAVPTKASLFNVLLLGDYVYIVVASYSGSKKIYNGDGSDTGYSISVGNAIMRYDTSLFYVDTMTVSDNAGFYDEEIYTQQVCATSYALYIIYNAYPTVGECSEFHVTPTYTADITWTPSPYFTIMIRGTTSITILPVYATGVSINNQPVVSISCAGNEYYYATTPYELTGPTYTISFSPTFNVTGTLFDSFLVRYIAGVPDPAWVFKASFVAYLGLQLNAFGVNDLFLSVIAYVGYTVNITSPLGVETMFDTGYENYIFRYIDSVLDTYGVIYADKTLQLNTVNAAMDTRGDIYIQHTGSRSTFINYTLIWGSFQTTPVTTDVGGGALVKIGVKTPLVYYYYNESVPYFLPMPYLLPMSGGGMVSYQSFYITSDLTEFVDFDGGLVGYYESTYVDTGTTVALIFCVPEGYPVPPPATYAPT